MLFAFREPKREPLKLTVREKLLKMDFGGTILFIASIVCLFLALQWGGNDVPWSNPRPWGLLLGFALLLIAFIILQIHMGEKYAFLKVFPASHSWLKILQCYHSSQNLPQPKCCLGSNGRRSHDDWDEYPYFLSPFLLPIG